MIQLIENNRSPQKKIDSYGVGGFRIDGEVHFGNLLICENQTHRWSQAMDIVSFFKKADHLDLLIYGSGERIFDDDSILAELNKCLSVGIECLDTPSGCRLYNMLLSEGRNVAAALKNI